MGGRRTRAPEDRAAARPIDATIALPTFLLDRTLGADSRGTSAHRPAECRGRVRRPRPSPRRRLGSISARRFSKPSAVTRPAATSSHNASSVSLGSRLAARARSAKKSARSASSAARHREPHATATRDLRSASCGPISQPHPRGAATRSARRESGESACLRHPRAPDAATRAPTSPRPKDTARRAAPARTAPIRRGRICASHAAAGIS